MYGRLMVLGLILAAFALPSTAHAGSASPNPVEFGDVPINTTVTRDVTITVDAGYRTEIASGTGINAPFGFSFDTCGAGGGFTGPGTCTVKQRFTPTSAVSLERLDQRLPVPRRRRHLHPDHLRRQRQRGQQRRGEPEPGRVRRRADQHDRDT